MPLPQDWRDALSAETPARLLALAFDGKSLPDVADLQNVPEPIQHHPEGTTGRHLHLVMEQVWKLTTSPGARLAALMHDIGKADSPNSVSHNGHDRLGGLWMYTAFSKCGLPMEHQRLCERTATLHQRLHGLSTKTTPQAGLHLIEALGPDVTDDAFAADLAAACESDARGRLGLSERPYPQAALFLAMRARVLEAGLTLPIQRDDGGKEINRLRGVVAAVLGGRKPEPTVAPIIVALSWRPLADEGEAKRMGEALGRPLAQAFANAACEGSAVGLWVLSHPEDGMPPLAAVAVKDGRIATVMAKNNDPAWKASISKAMSDLSSQLAPAARQARTSGREEGR